jgi:hypothetical protein
MESIAALPIRAPTSEGVILREAFVSFDSETIQLGIFFTGPGGASNQRSPLGDAGVKDLLDALVQGKFTRVKTIDAFMSDVSDVSVERIAQALKTNSTVTDINLVSSLPSYLLLLQSSCSRSLQYVTRAVCTDPQLGYY